jgi:hypothetical protein
LRGEGSAAKSRTLKGIGKWSLLNHYIGKIADEQIVQFDSKQKSDSSLNRFFADCLLFFCLLNYRPGAGSGRSRISISFRLAISQAV